MLKFLSDPEVQPRLLALLDTLIDANDRWHANRNSSDCSDASLEAFSAREQEIGKAVLALFKESCCGGIVFYRNRAFLADCHGGLRIVHSIYRFKHGRRRRDLKRDAKLLADRGDPPLPKPPLDPRD